MVKLKKNITVKLDDLTGSMNIAKSPEFIKDNEVVRLENMEFDIVGSKLRARRGLSTPPPLASFNSPVTHIYNDYEMNDFFVFLENIEVYRYEFGKVDPNPVTASYKSSIYYAIGTTNATDWLKIGERAIA